MKVLVILVSNNHLPDKSVKMNSKKSSKVGMTMGSSVLLRLAEFEFVTVVLLEEEDSSISYPIYLLEFLQGQFSSMFVSISPEKVLTIFMSSSLN